MEGHSVFSVEPIEQVGKILSKGTTSVHVTALDGLVNVNSLFTVAVFVGLSLAKPKCAGQGSLEEPGTCVAGNKIPELKGMPNSKHRLHLQFQLLGSFQSAACQTVYCNRRVHGQICWLPGAVQSIVLALLFIWLALSVQPFYYRYPACWFIKFYPWFQEGEFARTFSAILFRIPGIVFDIDAADA